MSTPLPKGTPGFWTIKKVVEALGPLLKGGAPRADAKLAGVTTDTREITKGQLFVALRGENFDAHDFLADAVEKGATAVVVSKVNAGRDLDVPVFVVRDTLEALGALGAYRRRVWGKPVIAVAGSNGKTTTKEFIRAALATKFNVHATTGNLNNLVGVPLTLLALPDKADVAVIELGTNQPGEVETLRRIVQPSIAVLTSIGEEHLEGLGSIEAVLREESAVFDEVKVAVLPAAEKEALAAAEKSGARVVTAGFGEGDIAASRWATASDGLPWALLNEIRVRSPLAGMHNLRNALVAVAVAKEMGITETEAARGIAGAESPGMRSAVSPLGSATLINDAYNANPGSMRAALDLLDEIGKGRPRVAILGTMLELGEHSDRMHSQIAERTLRSSIDVIAGVGAFVKPLVASGDPRVVTADDVEWLWTLLEPKLPKNAVILLKGSRGMKLERIVPRLKEWSEGHNTKR